MEYTEKEIKEIADEYANLSYNKDANPIDHEMITTPFIEGFKKALIKEYRFTREDIINALHKAELKHDKDYSKIWAIMEDALNIQAGGV